jgi:hypothetical protein
MAGASVEVEVVDAGRVAGQLEGACHLLELAGATELDFPHLKRQQLNSIFHLIKSYFFQA